MQRLGHLRVLSIVACFGLSAFFAWLVRETLLPSSRLVAEVLGWGDAVPVVGAVFVGFGALFAATGRTIPRAECTFPLPKAKAWLALVAPALLGLGYGLWHPDPAVWRRPGAVDSVLWYVVAVPIAEELVFRGGLYGALVRLGGDAPLTWTNPLPTAVWAQAAAFAVWHWDAGPAKVAMTFLLGIWLGWLRWRTGQGSVLRGLRWPVLAHVAVNTATILL